MHEPLFLELEKRNVSFGSAAKAWFEAVLPNTVEAFEIDSGTIINENGASTWHRVMVLTKTCIFTWQVNALEDDDEDALDNSHYEVNNQIVPFSQVGNVITKMVYSQEGSLQTVSASVILLTQDFAHSESMNVAEDETHAEITIFHDALGIARSVARATQEEVNNAALFVAKLGRLFAASR